MEINMRLRLMVAFLAIVVPMVFTVRGGAADIEVPCWQPHDFSFTSTAAQANPFQVTFSAEVTAPDGTKLTIPGFFDGDRRWKVRISPTALGLWSLVAHSTVPELNDQRGSFVCIANPSTLIHGALRIDPEHLLSLVAGIKPANVIDAPSSSLIKRYSRMQ